MLPIFITGNQTKADYFSRQMGITLERRDIKLDEIQSFDLHAIVDHKLEQAYAACKAPVLVEDAGLFYNALGGLPGPYIKWFLDRAGDEACCAMLNGFADRSAYIQCTYGYYDGTTTHYFDSKMPGLIAPEPSGSIGFGFDRIFIQDGYTVTRASLTQEENERTYAEQMKPFADVRTFLETLV